MRMFRVGDKVVSREKLLDAVNAILEDREAGATQDEAARRAGVQRSFVSFLESLGEVRRGPRVALVAFPVANRDEVRALADKYALDFTLILSQSERELIESGNASNVFNQLLDTLAVLREFDTLVLIASDLRVKTMERILGTEVVGIQLGSSPLRDDRVVDLAELEKVLSAVLSSASTPAKSPRRVGQALRDAAELAGRWTQSKRSSV